MSLARKIEHLYTQVQPVFRLSVGGILTYSGLIHIWKPFVFANSVAAYGIFPAFAVGVIVLVLPSLQIVTGGLLLFRIAERANLYFAGSIFASFCVVQLVVIVSGREVSCGCFGLGSKDVGLSTVAIPIACCAWCIVESIRNGMSRGERDTRITPIGD